jgi:cytochrome c-type protein NapB
MMRLWIPVGLVILLCACAVRVEQVGIPDDLIGLSKVDVRDVPDPDPVADDTTEPGEGGMLERAYEGAPPVISHLSTDFLPITRTENLCLECHMFEGEAEEGLPTPIPASHYTDLRHAPSVVSDEVVGARYNCTLCHVPRTGAAPLVKSGF